MPIKNKKKLTEAEAPQATPTDASSKAMMMAQVVNGMANLNHGDMTNFFNSWMALIGHEADSIPDGTAAKNLASINSSGAVNEELKGILAGESLSEELQEKTAVLFEAAVGTRVALIEQEIIEAHEELLNEEIDNLNEALIEQIDQYLTYVAEQWVRDNKAAVQTSIKTELAEDFIAGLFKLFSEHNVSIPDNQIDAVEALTEALKLTRQQLNEQLQANINSSRRLESFEKGEALAEVTEGLALTQVEQIKKLSEGLDFTDTASYKKKLKVLRENFSKGAKPAKMLTETVVPEVAKPSPMMLSLKNHIEKSVKN